MIVNEYRAVVAAHDAARNAAFARIRMEHKSARKRVRAMLEWYRHNPSPRSAREQMENIARAIFGEGEEARPAIARFVASLPPQQIAAQLAAIWGEEASPAPGSSTRNRTRNRAATG
jgi:hypothetical protein